MTLPENITTITITGTYLDFQGNAASGTVAFTPSASELMDTAAPAMLDAVPIIATLDSNGHFSVVVPCTDNANLGPAGWNYVVTETIHGIRSYSVNVPHTLGSSVDIATLAPASGV